MFATRRGLLIGAVALGLIVVVGLVAFAFGAFGGGAATPTPTKVSATPTTESPTATAKAPTATTEAATATPTAAPTTPAPTVTIPATGTAAGTATATQAATAVATGTATGAAPVTVKLGGTQALGPFLVDVNGMTLYTFANDTAGTSTCTGGCAENWPPLTVAPGTALVAGEGVPGTLATITRADGSLQVTYNGHPLYHYRGDTAPGDAKGQGFSNLWFVAAP